MTIKVREALAQFGLQAEFRGNKGMILPVSASLLQDFAADDASDVGQNIDAGQLVASWSEDGKRKGMVLNAGAGNDIVLMIARNDGTEYRVPASDLNSAAVSLIGMERDAAREAVAVADQNAKARADYEVAIGKGETPDEPVDRKPTFKDGAFARFTNLVECVKNGIDATLGDEFSDIVARSSAYAAKYEIGRANAAVLTQEEMGKIATARAMREEIGRLNPTHPDGLAPFGVAFDGDNKVAREAVNGLRIGGTGFSATQMAALASNPVLS